MKVSIVDDDPLVRRSLGAMIGATERLELHGDAATLADGRTLLNAAPDVMLVDLGLPDGSGLDLIEQAWHSRSECRMLVLTVLADVATVVRAIEVGADGYLLKSSDVTQVAVAIDTVMAGGAPISPAVAGHILARLRGGPRSSQRRGSTGASLTSRETDVLQGLADGCSFREVAVAHGISHHTVGDHVKSIYRKLSVNSRGQAVSAAVQAGIVRIGS